MLHHPAYRAKYEINLKPEFPRLPCYEDFRQWAAWGRTLMELHLGYEQAAPFPLARHAPRHPRRDVGLQARQPQRAGMGARSGEGTQNQRPTVAAKFNIYRFTDHKESVIALLARVSTVSVETMKIVRAMPERK